MPQLNYSNPDVLNLVVDGLQKWIQYNDIDGFKIGAANLISINFNFTDDYNSKMSSNEYNVHTRDLYDSINVVRELVQQLNNLNPDVNL